MRFTVGEFVFDSKQDAETAIRQILHTYPDGTILAGATAR